MYSFIFFFFYVWSLAFPHLFSLSRVLFSFLFLFTVESLAELSRGTQEAKVASKGRSVGAIGIGAVSPTFPPALPSDLFGESGLDDGFLDDDFALPTSVDDLDDLETVEDATSAAVSASEQRSKYGSLFAGQHSMFSFNQN